MSRSPQQRWCTLEMPWPVPLRADNLQRHWRLWCRLLTHPPLGPHPLPCPRPLCISFLMHVGGPQLSALPCWTENHDLTASSSPDASRWRCWPQVAHLTLAPTPPFQCARPSVPSSLLKVSQQSQCWGGVNPLHPLSCSQKLQASHFLNGLHGL